MARVATVLCAKSVEKDAFQYFMFLRSLISNFVDPLWTKINKRVYSLLVTTYLNVNT